MGSSKHNTKVWKLSPQDHLSEDRLAEAGDILAAGGLVAFPTETVYGLGADARSSEAVQQIFEAKGRPSDNPLIVHLYNSKQAEGIAAELSPLARQLMDRFWPGPLTIIVPVKPGAIAANVTAGLDTVALRVPNHSLALSLIKAANCPVAAPSANRSGRPSPTEAKHVLEDLEGRIDGIVDGGAAGIGLESTVVEVKDDSIIVLRPGGITVDDLRGITDQVKLDTNITNDVSAHDGSAPRSPGMKYRHYAPKGSLTLVKGEASKRIRWINEQIQEAKVRGHKTGVLAFQAHRHDYSADTVISMGDEQQLEQAARKLYDALRAFDEARVTMIWAEATLESGMGLALMNRLMKAAEYQVVHI